MTGLPEAHTVTPNDIERYFEANGEDVEVRSVVALKNGNFQVQLSGLSESGKLLHHFYITIPFMLLYVIAICRAQLAEKETT